MENFFEEQKKLTSLIIKFETENCDKKLKLKKIKSNYIVYCFNLASASN